MEEQTKEMIDIETFARLDMRVGKVIACENIPKSRNLLRMDIDLGEETRQVLAGLAPYYIPHEVVGKRVIVLANLKPVKLMGYESQGMILAAPVKGQPGTPCFLTAPEGVPIGSRVG